MKRKKRDFSPRERRLIDGFIKDICRSIGLPQGIRDLHQCAWEAFLSVYRDAPFAFCGDGISGWKRAYLIIREALLQEKRRSQSHGSSCCPCPTVIFKTASASMTFYTV